MTNVVQFTPRTKQSTTNYVPPPKTGVHYMMVQYVIDAARAYAVRKDGYENMQTLLNACTSADPGNMVCQLDDQQWALYMEAIVN